VSEQQLILSAAAYVRFFMHCWIFAGSMAGLAFLLTLRGEL